MVLEVVGMNLESKRVVYVWSVVVHLMTVLVFLLGWIQMVTVLLNGLVVLEAAGRLGQMVIVMDWVHVIPWGHW